MSSDRVAIVTGGSLGIGLATVAALAGRGFNVVTTARDKARLDAAVAALAPDHRGRVTALGADVTKEREVTESIGEAVRRLGRLDVLINSAGVSMSARTRLVDSNSAEWHRIIDTNLTGTYLMCHRNAVDRLRLRGRRLRLDT